LLFVINALDRPVDVAAARLTKARRFC